jgi:hypothetical protein
LQVLPSRWKSFNPKPLLDLLLLPRPPIGRFAARKLARALVEEPGTGAKAWSSAWAEIAEDLKARLADQPNAQGKAAARMQRWREWTTGGLYSRTDGISTANARAIAARVSLWAIETDQGAKDPLLLSVAGAASAPSQAVDVLGLDPIPGLLVERIIEQVLAEGAQNPSHVAEAGGLRHPASSSAVGLHPTALLVGFQGTGRARHTRSLEQS